MMLIASIDKEIPVSLEALALPPQSGNAPTGLVVVLHGWGANAEDVASLAPLLDLPDYQILMPDAPFSHPHNPSGRMWYGFPESYSFLGTPEFRQRPDLVKSRELLRDWLTGLEDETGVPLSRTVLSGFSQGGAMTLEVGLSLPLAGLMVLSGYAHAPLEAAEQPLPPVLMVHGTGDWVVPLRSAHNARDQLLSLGAQVEYHERSMGHEIQIPVLNLMREFVAQVI